MKKIISFVLILAFVFSVNTNTRVSAETNVNQWLEQDAKVSPYVYSYLLDQAGFSAYIYTGNKVNLKQKVPNFKVIEENAQFIIGSLRNGSHIGSNRVLITQDGLVVSYAPKEMAHTIFSNNRHFLDVQYAVKNFVGPTVDEVNYINFASLDSNKALTFFKQSSDPKADFIIPSAAKINDIGFSYNYQNNGVVKPSAYGTILSDSLQPGSTHAIKAYGSKYDIDDINVFRGSIESMNVFYTSDQVIGVDSKSESYKNYNLRNNFRPVITDVTNKHGAYNDIRWAVLNGLIRGYENGSFKPENTLTESQFVSILSKYYQTSTTYNTESAYSFFEKYNLPLKGYTDKSARNEPVSRGTVAQVFSMLHGGPNDVQGSYDFLYKNKITVSPSFQEYKSSSNLKRSHISSFFKRLNDAGYTNL